MKVEEKNTDLSSNWTIKIYKTNVLSKLWWTLYLIFSVSVIFLFTYVLFSVDLAEFWIPIMFILPITIAVGVLAFSSIVRLTLRLTITNSGIRYDDILRSKQMAFHDVTGFRIISTAQRSDIGLPGWEVEIESTKRAIITVPKSIENQKELIAFLNSKFMNLDEHAMKVYLELKSGN